MVANKYPITQKLCHATQFAAARYAQNLMLLGGEPARRANAADAVAARFFGLPTLDFGMWVNAPELSEDALYLRRKCCTSSSELAAECLRARRSDPNASPRAKPLRRFSQASRESYPPRWHTAYDEVVVRYANEVMPAIGALPPDTRPRLQPAADTFSRVLRVNDLSRRTLDSSEPLFVDVPCTERGAMENAGLAASESSTAPPAQAATR